jgi:Bacteriophage tail sheath protein
MPASFLHGVEVAELNTGPRPVTVVKSAVIGLVGTAPVWSVSNPPPALTPILVSSAPDAAQFGPLIKGYTIPYALAAIQAQGAGQAIVINVFDPALHTSPIAATPYTFSTAVGSVGQISLGHMGVSQVVVTSDPAGTTYSLDTDYTLDAVNGVVTLVAGGAINAGATVLVSFDYADPSVVIDSDVIGAYANGAYSGLQALKTTYSTMGFFAKILIAPGYSQNSDVASALTTMAETLRAMALVDSAPGTSSATTIANRGSAGASFDTSSNRVILCFPQQVFVDNGLDPTTGAPVNANSVAPFSQYVAGAMAAKDLAKGYWWSPSNTQFEGALGPDVPLYASILDPASDVNTLNSEGIVTVFNSFGTGLRVWGNRSAAYPTSTAPDNFISVRRTMDVIEDSVELAMLQFIDQPISNALITAILASVNGFIRSLIQRGALVDGSASYDPAQNPPSQVAAGQLVFDIDVMPPPPAERISFNVTIDTNLLQQLGQSNPLGASLIGAAGNANP